MDGQILNQKGIGTTVNDIYPDCIKSNNNKIYLICNTLSDTISGDKTDVGFGLGGDLWLIELDQNLNILNDKCYGGTGIEEFPRVHEINNSLYITGQSNSNPSGNKTAPKYTLQGRDGWLVKLESNLSVEWDRTYGGFGHEQIGDIYQNGNGNFILSLISNSIPSGNKTSVRYGTGFDSWLVITDGSGNVITQETYGGIDDEGGSIFTPYLNSEQVLIMSAVTASGSTGNKTVTLNGIFDTWIIEIDASNFLNVEKIEETQSTISVYPNPFSEKVNFDFNELKEEAILSLFSIEGQLIYETKIVKGSSTFSWTPSNVDQFFIYKLTSNSFQHTGKITNAK
jgi:hypothetical protein